MSEEHTEDVIAVMVFFKKSFNQEQFKAIKAKLESMGLVESAEGFSQKGLCGCVCCEQWRAERDS